jgi:hypothetical protein
LFFHNSMTVLLTYRYVMRMTPIIPVSW